MTNNFKFSQRSESNLKGVSQAKTVRTVLMASLRTRLGLRLRKRVPIHQKMLISRFRRAGMERMVRLLIKSGWMRETSEPEAIFLNG